TGPNGFTSTDQNLDFPSAAITHTGTYTVLVTSPLGCTSTASADVVVNPYPVVNFTADVLSGCVPFCVDFTDLSSVSSSNIAAWDWQVNGTTVSSQQNPTYCFSSPGAFSVSLMAVSDEGCTASLTINNYING